MPKNKNPKTEKPHIRGEILPVPVTILYKYKELILVGDIMFINSIRFINTISIHLKFMTAEHITNVYATTLQ